MPHELTLTAGKTEMAYVGAAPWHGLGQTLTAGADIDTWKREAGMDWAIARAPVMYPHGTMPDKHVLFRNDTHAALSVVSRGYKIVQPGDVLEFFRDLTGAAGFQLETAGTMYGGRQFWALARVAEATIVGADAVRTYLMLATACDGSMATVGKMVNERVVCRNTLSIALGEKSATVKVRHNTVFNAEAVKRDLGVAHEAHAAFVDAARALAKVKLETSTVEAQVAKMLLDARAVTGANAADNVQKAPGFLKIMGLFGGSAMGGGLAGARGTAWGMVNAVTEYVDHHSRAQTLDGRLNSAWFGDGDRLKTVALNNALALV